VLLAMPEKTKEFYVKLILLVISMFGTIFSVLAFLDIYHIVNIDDILIQLLLFSTGFAYLGFLTVSKKMDTK
jgi:hypothetical protein